MFLTLTCWPHLPAFSWVCGVSASEWHKAIWSLVKTHGLWLSCLPELPLAVKIYIYTEKKNYQQLCFILPFFVYFCLVGCEKDFKVQNCLRRHLLFTAFRTHFFSIQYYRTVISLDYYYEISPSSGLFSN